MNFKTDRSKVSGLGSAKSGASHWFGERLKSVALIPLMNLPIYASPAGPLNDTIEPSAQTEPAVMVNATAPAANERYKFFKFSIFPSLE